MLSPSNDTGYVLFGQAVAREQRPFTHRRACLWGHLSDSRIRYRHVEHVATDLRAEPKICSEICPSHFLSVIETRAETRAAILYEPPKSEQVCEVEWKRGWNPRPCGQERVMLRWRT